MRWLNFPWRRQVERRSAQARPCVEPLETRLVLTSADNLQFVTRAFQDLLHHPGDPAGLAQLSSLINRNLVTRAQIVQGIEGSPEYRAVEVQQLYAQFLHRSADPAAAAAGIAYLGAGGTVEQLASAIVSSAEYFQAHGGTADGFLAALYHDALGRGIDPVGESVLDQALVNGTPRSQIASFVFASPEYETDLVESYYQEFLHRTGDSFGVTSFVSILQQGGRDEQVILDFLTSDEYAPGAADPILLSAEEVEQLLERAAAASASNDAIIAVVDRGGRVLGVRAESGVSPALLNDPAQLTFAVDGALALARTGAFFANDQAPLTSRTVQFISQSTITQREVESNPDIPDLNSPLRGPGFVAPVGLGGHFPPNVAETPPVDLFGIEHTNRDSIIDPGPDHIKGTADDVMLSGRFNINPAFVPPGQTLTPPESYGFVSGILPSAQARGIATLPGGIPLFKQGELVGGIGVFFPGTTGYATAENSSLSATYNPALPDRSLEAEYMAFAAAGGSSGAGASIGTLGGVPPLPGFDLPFGRIDLAGITLDIYGPGGNEGPSALVTYGSGLGVGNPHSGADLPVNPGPDGKPMTPDDILLLDGAPVPEGWLVTPHAGGGLTASDVLTMITQGINEANLVRAQIRLPLQQHTEMVFAVTDSAGEVLGLYRMHDATVFSLDVAVAKARNAAYFDDPSQLQPIDQIPGVPTGVAFTARTFRFTAQPRFPEGIDGTPPAPQSILNDPGINPTNGLNAGPPQPASVYQSAYGYDSFNPDTNFHQPWNPNQNGVVFFPGSSVLYKAGNQPQLPVGGLGVSGDGVDQDDIVTAFAAQGYGPPPERRADQFLLNGVRLPYQKFPRNPEG
jgi:uncharacterized protein GlcG (DUF336 family)